MSTRTSHRRAARRALAKRPPLPELPNIEHITLHREDRRPAVLCPTCNQRSDSFAHFSGCTLGVKL